MNKFLIFLVVLTTSLSVSFSELSIIHTILFTFLVILSSLKLFGNTINFSLCKYYYRLLAVFGISLFFSLTINYIYNTNYLYFLLNPVGRIFNLFGAFIIILFIDAHQHYNNIIKWYFYSCLIIVVSAIWHALDLYSNLPLTFPFETRSLVHSSSLDFSFSARLTGIAQEPSYLASFLLDFWILSLIVFYNKKFWKNLMRGGCLVLILLTYSPSAYISLIILLAFEILYKLFKNNKFYFFVISGIFISILPIIFIVLNSFNIESLSYFKERINNADKSGRFYILDKAITSIYEDNNIFTLIFGNGLKSFELLQYRFSEISVSTSNNLYVDVFFEAGLLGLIILLCFYYFVFIKIIKIQLVKYKFFASLIFINIIVSGFYRADYATLRYFILFYFIYIFINYKKYFNEE